MDPEFMRMLQELRDQMQGPLRVSSARRCDHHNDQVSTAKNKKNGVHTLGQASDILISGERAMLLFEKSTSDWLQRDRSFTEGRSRLTICPPGYETEKGSLELLEVVNRLIHKWTLRYHAPFSLNLAGIGFGLTSPIIKSFSGKDCSRVYPK